MRKIAIALLATTVIGTPALAASSGTQPQNHEMQPQNNGKAQTQNGSQRNAQEQQTGSPKAARSAANDKPTSPQRLSRQEIRQVQQTLDKDGFHAGSADGRWGPETRNAIKKFQQSKDIRADGRLNRQTMADLGLGASRYSPRSKTNGM